MSAPLLRPPLPPPLSHAGITFVFDAPNTAATLAPETVAAIATALSAILPAGDLVLDPLGNLSAVGTHATSSAAASLWYQAGLLVGIERSPR
jgi:hypothetical protein